MIYFKGIIFLIIVAVVFITAFRFFKNNQIHNALIFIILGGFILRGWCIFNDGFLFAWDERYHALVAKNLGENPFLPVLFKTPLIEYDFRQWTINHVWLHKQPLSLWLMAGSIKLFGASEWAIRLPSLLLSTLGIYLTFRIARFFKDDKVGLLAAFFQAVNGLLIEITAGRESTDHPDNVFFFFIELSVFWILIFFKRKSIFNLILIGLWLGLAIMSKWLPALIVLPIFIILTVDTEGVKKTILNLTVISVAASLVAVPWQIYIFQRFPLEAAWEYSNNIQHFTKVFEGHDGSIWWHLIKAMRIWNELIYVVFAWFLYKIFAEKSNKKWWALLIWIAVPYMFFSIASTKMIAYPLFTAPAIFTILAMFWWQLYDKPLKIKVLNQLILIAIMVISIRYGYERLFLFKNNNLYLMETARIKSWQPDDKTVIFNIPEKYIETMFYTSVAAAYPFIPTDEQIEKLKQKGYKIWIVESSNISPELLLRKDVHFIDN